MFRSPDLNGVRGFYNNPPAAQAHQDSLLWDQRSVWRMFRERSFSSDSVFSGSKYICQLCGGRARFPREKTHTFRFKIPLLGEKSWTVAYITPMVCATCRMMRQPEVTALGDGRRRFWKRALAIYLGETYPSAGPRMNRAIYARLRIPWLWHLTSETVSQNVSEAWRALYAIYRPESRG
jgi:hypothetical protein